MVSTLNLTGIPSSHRIILQGGNIPPSMFSIRQLPCLSRGTVLLPIGRPLSLRIYYPAGVFIHHVHRARQTAAKRFLRRGIRPKTLSWDGPEMGWIATGERILLMNEGHQGAMSQVCVCTPRPRTCSGMSQGKQLSVLTQSAAVIEKKRPALAPM